MNRLLSALSQEGGALAIYGERGVGKSYVLSAVNAYREELNQVYGLRYQFVFINCQDILPEPIPAQFWGQVIQQIKDKVADDLTQSKCQEFLSGAKFLDSIDHNDFCEVLDLAAQANIRIALLLDDFDCMIRTEPEHRIETHAFLQGIRFLTTRDSHKINIITATRSSLEQLGKPLAQPNYSAFHNNFTNYRLRFFTPKELQQLLEQLLQSVTNLGQPNFSVEEQNYVAYVSGYHPKLAKLAATEIVNQRLESGTPLTQLDRVGERFRTEAGPLFETFWQGAIEVEQTLLMLVALKECQGKLSTVHYDLGDCPEFSRYERELFELSGRGLIQRASLESDQWQIFSPIFQWWILKEIESSNPGELDDRKKVWGNLVKQERADQLGKIIEFLKEKQALSILWNAIIKQFGN
jgi:hypothetical protein